MRDYDRTLWENNKTVVDAEKLNNVEDQIQVLTINSVDNNKRLSEVEFILPNKANKDHSHEEYSLKEHTHEEYSLKDHTHDDFTTNEEFDTIKGDVEALTNRFNDLKEELDSEFKKYFDDAEVEEDMLHLYSHGVLLKSLQLPKGQGSSLAAICGEFLSGDINCGEGTNYTSRSYDPTVWQDGVTPVNAFNLNKIENKLLELSELINEIPGVGSSDCIHTGSEPPRDTSKLWVDTEDEDVDETDEQTIVELFAKTLQEHKIKIDELFYLTDAYLDDGLFEEEYEDEQKLDGGIF